jgi:hypothetical protein
MCTAIDLWSKLNSMDEKREAVSMGLQILFRLNLEHGLEVPRSEILGYGGKQILISGKLT